MPLFLYVIFGLFFFLLSISFLIAIHEYGHYLIAKKSGAHIYEFSIGFGPAIFKREDKDGTMWSIKLFPLGGYVLPHSNSVEYFLKELGELENISEEEKIQKEKELNKYSMTYEKLKSIGSNQNIDNKKIHYKLLFTMGGILMNLLVVFSALMISYKTLGKLENTNEAYLIANINDQNNNSTAYKIDSAIAIKDGNQIKYNGNEFDKMNKSFFYTDYEEIDIYTKNLPEEPIKFGNSYKEKRKYQYEYIGDVTILKGVELKYSNFIQNGFYVNLTGLDLFTQSFVDTFIYIGRAFSFLIFLIIPSYQFNFAKTYVIDNNVTVGENLNNFFRNQIILMAQMSALLLAFNVLPIPPMDGYKFSLYAYESIFRKKVSPKTQEKIDRIGWAFIMFLTVWMLFAPLI